LDVQLGSGNDNGEPIGEPAPVFLYACGWRAGSTLLQRLIVSSQQVLMWGEPYALCGLVQMLTGASRPLLKGYPESFYPEPSELTEAAQVEIRDKLTSSWIANVHPHPKRFKRALRALFDELYGAQAKAAGYPRFGVKEVRLGAPQAVFLKWLYPQSKAIFLVRDPRDCWRSAKAIAENKVWDLPFGPPVTDAQSYARLWREVADSFMPTDLQIKLLRVLQDRKVVPLGANDELAVDVRVLAATKEDLNALSNSGGFRKDLYYRLDVLTLNVPPLRSRRDDIPLLFQQFVNQACDRFKKPPVTVTPDKLSEVMRHDWPGNVRELQNAALRHDSVPFLPVPDC